MSASRRRLEVPETRYVRNGDVHIAYQVFGEGDVTFVGIPGIVSNIEVMWEDADSRGYLTGLARFCRCVVFDKRGQGLSDRDGGVGTLDDRLSDLGAVLDAVGAERAALAGMSEGGTTAAMFAASHPERVSHLLLWAAFARADVERGDRFLPRWAQTWGTPETLSVRVLAPGKLGDDAFLRWLTHFERQSASPGALLASWRWVREIDIRAALPAIQCPAMVMHRRGDAMIDVTLSRYLAEHIPAARLIELPGDGHAIQWGDYGTVLDIIEEFLTGRASGRSAERVLATLVFTDIVQSTSQAAALGDARWRRVLDRHDEVSERIVRDHGGRTIKSTGDGLLASFDAPGRALSAANALRDALHAAGIDIRSGLHTGEVELRGEDVGGIGVHIAARVLALAEPGETLVSRTVKDLVAGSGFAFLDRGTHELKGVPDRWQLFAVREPAAS